MNCVKIAKEKRIIARLVSAFNFKKITALTKKELDNPGKNIDIRKQDSNGRPVEETNAYNYR